MSMNREVAILNQSLNTLREEVHAFNMQMRVRVYSITDRLDKLNEVLKDDGKEKKVKANKAGVIEATE